MSREVINSLICEMSSLKDLTTHDDKIDCKTVIIPFHCSDIKVVRFLAELGMTLVFEYDKACYAEVTVLPAEDEYLLKLVLEELQAI